MRRSRSRCLGSVALVALGLAASPAAAQSVIAFGDSLMDNGNLSLFTGGGTPPSPPYFQGRFSNGPTFAEIVAGGTMQTAGHASALLQPVDLSRSQNYAFGGARTDDNFPPSIPDQIGFYETQLSNQGAQVSASDLFLLNGGANNILQAFLASSPTPTFIVSEGVDAAVDTAGSAGRLAQLGARTIAVINLPDLGLVPRLNTSATGSAVGTAATDAYNATLSTGLFAAAAANPGADIHLVDVQPLFRDIVANPGRYGFSNSTEACLNVPSCAGASNAAQNAFLFFDDVHPTAAGHQLFASLILDNLTAGAQAGQAVAFSEIGVADRLAGENALRERARALMAGTDAIAQGADLADPMAAPTSYGGLYVSLDGMAFDRDASTNTAGYEYRAGTVRIGADYRLSDAFLFGGAVSGSQGEVRDSRFGFDTQSFSADLYGTFVSGPAFLTVTGGVAHFDFDDIRRQTLVATVVNEGGDTDGFSANIGAEAGYAFTFGAFTATPTLGLSYVHFDVDGFEEDGLGARIVYEGYDRNVLYGAANLHLSHAVSLAGRRATFTGRIGYEDALTDGGDDGIVSTIAGSPALPSLAGFDDMPGRGFILGAGAEVDVTEKLALSAKYSVGFSGDLGTSHVGSISLGYRF